MRNEKKTAQATLVDAESAWREEIAKHHPQHEPPFDPLNCVWCQRLQAVSRQGEVRRFNVSMPSQRCLILIADTDFDGQPDPNEIAEAVARFNKQHDHS